MFDRRVPREKNDEKFSNGIYPSRVNFDDVFIVKVNNHIKQILTCSVDFRFSAMSIRLGDVERVEYEYCCWQGRFGEMGYFDAATTVELERNARNDALRKETI